MEIRPLTDTDLKSVAHVHMLAFPDAALTQFGIEAVRRYYLWQLNGSHNSSCMGTFIDNQLAGYCFAGVFRSEEIGFLRNNKVFLVWRLITHPWLLNNEMVQNRISEFVQAVKKYTVRKQILIEPQAPVTKKFGILSIAVHPHYQGLGIGKLLVKDVETSARQNGFNSIRLSVHPDNLKAMLFYEKLGWQKIPAANGIWVGYMAKDI